MIYSQVGAPEESKFRIAIIGGLYATEPQTRELLLHIGKEMLDGYVNQNTKINRILSESVIQLIPIFDHKPDPTKTQKTCYTTDVGEFPIPLLIATNQWSETAGATALWEFVKSSRFDLILILDAGDLQLRFVRVKLATWNFYRECKITRDIFRITGNRR